MTYGTHGEPPDERSPEQRAKENSEFFTRLEFADRIVASWPAWKRNLLGLPYDDPPQEKGTMAKARKKPVEIETIQWNGHNWQELCDWAEKKLPEEGHPFLEGPGSSIRIITLEGEMEAKLGDWIICGVKNEFYSCKPDIFEATYDIVEP